MPSGVKDRFGSHWNCGAIGTVLGWLIDTAENTVEYFLLLCPSVHLLLYCPKGKGGVAPFPCMSLMTIFGSRWDPAREAALSPCCGLDVAPCCASLLGCSLQEPTSELSHFSNSWWQLQTLGLEMVPRAPVADSSTGFQLFYCALHELYPKTWT